MAPRSDKSTIQETKLTEKLNIYLFDCFARNTGDLAILLSTIAGLKNELATPTITFESSHPTEVLRYNELKTCTVYPKIFDIKSFDNSRRQKLLSLLTGLYDMWSFFIWALLLRLGIAKGHLFIRRKRRDQAMALQHADVVISSGGGFLSTNYPYYQVRLYMFTLGKLLGKPVVIIAQSIGPFDTRTSRLLIPFFLKRLSAVV